MLGVEYVAELFAQILVTPLIEGVGLAKVLIAYGAVVVLHPPDKIESVTTKVPAPKFGHCTVIELVPAPLVIVPFVTCHLYILPELKGVLYVIIWFWHVVDAPVITGLGLLNIATEYAAVVVLHPVTLTLSETTRLPAPGEPQLTLMLAVP